MVMSKFSRSLTFNQNLISGSVLFFTVGIYLAVLGLGAGGGKPSSQQMSDISNSCLYAVFAVFGFFTGSILNKIGPKWTMLIGVFGYPFYVASLFYFDRTGRQGFPIAGGVVLGFCAPMMWSTASFIQMAYATEMEKGSYISIQYFINQVGSVVGSLVAFVLILNGESTADGSPTSVYIAFLCLMCVGFVIVLFGLIAPARVRRLDGTPIGSFHPLPYREELQGVGHILKDWRTILLLPVMFCCEWPISIIPSINTHYFNIRTRALCNILFYGMSLPTTIISTYLTDKLPCTRRTRGFYSIAFVTVFAVGGWVPLLSLVETSSKFRDAPANGVDWTDPGFAGFFIVVLIQGVLLTCYQIVGQWVMATFTNEPRKLAIYGGLWKGVAGGGLAVTFGMAASDSVSYSQQIIFMMSIQIACLPIMIFLVFKYCTETNYGNEGDVVIPRYAEEMYYAKGVNKEGFLEVSPAPEA